MLSERQAALLEKIEELKFQSKYSKLTELEKFTVLCQLAKEKNIAELKKILEKCLIHFDIKEEGHTPLSLLAAQGEHEAVAILFSLVNSVDAVIYGYACGGYLEQAAKYINDALEKANPLQKNPAFKYLLEESCASFVRGLLDGQHTDPASIECALSLIDELEIREKLAEKLSLEMDLDTMPILSLPRAGKIQAFRKKNKLSFNEVKSLSTPGLYGWMIYGSQLVAQGQLSFATFYTISTHLYPLSITETENVLKAVTFSTSYHGRQLFNTICQLALLGNDIELKKLIAHGVNLNMEIDGLTPASFLASKGEEAAVDFLIKQGIELNAFYTDLSKLIYEAAAKDEMEKVKNYFSAGNSEKLRNNRAAYYLYVEPLILAACKGFAEQGAFSHAKKREQIRQCFASSKKYFPLINRDVESQIKKYSPPVGLPSGINTNPSFFKPFQWVNSSSSILAHPNSTCRNSRDGSQK